MVFKGRAIDVPDDLDELVELLSEMFPGEKKRIAAFFDEALKVYEECYRDTHVYGVPLQLS
jgi:all-trans-retinol 13,14-reductase